ncbi:type I pullulanase [Anaeromicrobium sediminis]|uniref:Type I pullulanase n=1 Tax=Anaeromicrobium sediminis TaxID=1478221 RepID=A0A267MHA1_9FIRM|nr:type I pullulanase [Anaeromicrobium sediminis]PAB58792.1 type I pullulanase [Anaeromicrobium sediminis]
MVDKVDLDKYIYKGNDLGATYHKDYTMFKVWAPTQKNMKVIIYDNYSDINGQTYPMTKAENGVWELKLKGDYKNKYYNYILKDGMYEREITDPYTKGATANGQKGMVVDFYSINPKGWENHKMPKVIKSAQSVIYETHIRDFSVHKSSGMKNKGKYLGLSETGTKNYAGLATGVDYLKELGITHIHLLPIFDFASVDETNPKEYNWGYDPHLYNVPEGSYSTNPYDGRSRIQELKKMIMALHENDIRVIMDVVYNHTYESHNTPFNILVPKYYYRTDKNGNFTNGSGCGNEIASERPMVRKFIMDSLKFWATEYKIDGFRLDLMSLYDKDTIKEIERELKKINSNILIYGEPWTGGPSALEFKYQFRKGSQRGMGISLFNDDFRNAIKGDNDGIGLGFATGGLGLENEIKKGIVGSIYYNEKINGFAQQPIETINYVSSHDNLTLYDKIEKVRAYATHEEKVKINRLALSIILTSQGIAFLQGGTEILRTKKGNHNSYNAGDEVNSIDWDKKTEYLDNFNYMKGLIRLRKKQKVMMLEKAEDVRRYMRFIDSPSKSVAYLLNSQYTEDYRHILVIHNANLGEITIKLPFDGQWKVIANEYEVNEHGVSKGNKNFIHEVKVSPLSTYILHK